jgi:RNA polymerase sigma factor (sigma-70 family)
MRSLTPELIRCLSTVLDTRTDSDLLTGFLANRTPGDFAELVRRHGPMVWGTCRRTLPDYADAEDAFQTVFMVLVQRGKRLKDSATIGPWLHRVALWTTRNLRRRNARRLASRVPLPEQLAVTAPDPDLPLDLDTALLSLPEKFRSSILLCHVIGLTRAEAAAQLGCAERTLSFWLARGLAQLRHKLRGLDPTKALTLAALAVPVGLSESVVRAAMSLQATGIAATVLSSTVTQLVEGVLRMFWIKKATAATMSLFAMFALGVGIGVSTRQLSQVSGGDEKGVVQQPGTKTPSTDEKDLDAKIAEVEKSMAETFEALKKYG